MGIKSFVIDPDAVAYTNDEIVDKINAATADITRASSVSAAARPIEALEVDSTELADSAVTGARVRASETLTLTNQPLDTETVTLDSKVYVFQDILTDVDGNVKIGATVALSIANLISAINLNGTAGTDYATAMTLHPTVQAVAGTGDSIDVEAKDAGTTGNSIASTETLTNGAFGGATFGGGTDSKLAGGAAKDDLDGVSYKDRKYVKTDPETGEFRILGIQRDAAGDLDIDYDDQAAT
ncbi:hypothetical protein LCGC14_0662890 [marine sediment metagenome]|uniref:Uncharacterized protein n=1 Tax=marine sediment metagenome TaxID=412755 RepID=A0A0F9QY67_9ZZZZ